MHSNATPTFLRNALAMAAVMAFAIGADAARAREDNANRPFTIGVIGDMPYTTAPQLPQQEAFQGFINALSADPSFDLVIHLGDIKGGSAACTDPYIKSIRDSLNSYAGALVYTPGDNEWTDCHRNAADPKNPVERLDFLRAKFFFNPGWTLGTKPREVFTQASSAEFSAFVENQAWVRARTVLAVVNLPGSNNDLDPWTNGVGTADQQSQEFATRLAADLAWLDEIFSLADETHARLVVIGTQADMWDPSAGAAELTGYNEIVQKLARRVLEFGKPVLLLNGDSHEFKVDNPLANGDALHGVATPVPNLTRIVVQGGPSHFPLEYLKLTIDARWNRAPFAWERVIPTLAP